MVAAAGAALTAVAALAAPQSELVERVVAIVDRDIVLLSEAEQAMRVVSLRGSEPTLVDVVEQLIESTLIERELSRFADEPVPEEEVAQQLAALRSRFDNDEAFDAMLQARGLDESELIAELERQVAVARYLERRFRALTQVSSDEISGYFEREVLPRLEREREPTPEETRQIRSILEEQKFNRRVEEWIDNLKARASIRRYAW